jgi:hypothetical protein
VSVDHAGGPWKPNSETKRGAHVLFLRVRRTREEEVLPDEQPVGVGELVEVVGLVDTAAPDAD